MTEKDQGSITAHYVVHFGVPLEIRPFRPRGVSIFAIIEFGPAKGRRHWIYATNGMSSYNQLHPESGRQCRTELLAFTKNRVTWVDSLLLGLASYPIDYGTHFSEADTIAIGGPIDQIDSQYCGVLLANPVPETVGVVGGIDQIVLVHQVIGLHESEVDFARRQGGGVLWSRLLQSGGTLMLDEFRPPIV